MEDKEEKKIAGIEMPDFSTDDDLKLEVGVTYMGSFRIDRTGRIYVKPYKKGSKPQNLKKVVDGDRHAIYLSKNLIRIVFSIQKGQRADVNKWYQQTVIECYKDLNDLEL